MTRPPWHVYIVECSDGSLYTGITTDITKRVKTHNDGKGAKALKGKRPVKLVYSETFDDGTQAKKREYEIKQWKREHKVALIQNAKFNDPH
jgi:putative endonuclease